ncbi:MAG: iron-containing alcohol dehydrogenase [Candidatus Auribacter fodinae]|jgi:NADP-dependent alcohol dehydrogenase|uniref:Iron-containing alcohol dehydrogenase n=1 Tax=Candidatus Auribacter fodinae TaxID=2093366 RepID=A0A3A4QX01_9BACT|nr:MAG: iron-containing alcohol dehydrogenase [Candidatus Auribacter fodinae]
MQNFTYHNPVKLVFGKGSIKQLADLIPSGTKIMMTYGGGSIKTNGVYDQVKNALRNHTVIEFGGIEANPLYETLMKAVELGKKENAGFLLSVGGGSVLDGTKFIAAAMRFEKGDPWEILASGAEVKSAVPIGCVLTLSATGSEMNGFSVVSRKTPTEKRAFASPHVYPQFSILDPETTCSLPKRQVINGIIDPFVHVTEQYLTFDLNTPLQDRQAEGILLTLIDQGPKALQSPKDYDIRANLMWCATQALNGLIGCGVAHDWATHYIGHELTALYGIDHAQSLAVVLPGVLRHQKARKLQKLAQYGRRVWNISGLSDSDTADQAIARTESFFRSLGVATTLTEYNIPEESGRLVADRISGRGEMLGEHQAIGKKEIREILDLCYRNELAHP